jgi:acylphosphatase
MSDTLQPDHGGAVGRLVHYSGEVQGVGFRATAVSIARAYRVTGWVRNLPDGRVQLLAEGSEEEVTRFLDAIRDRWGDFIHDTQVEPREPTGRHTGFAAVH